MKEFGLGFHPEMLLLGQPFGGGRDFGDRLALAGAGVIDHGDVAGLDRALDLLKLTRCSRSRFSARSTSASVTTCSSRLDEQALVFGQLELRRRLDRGGKLQRLPAAELDLLDVGVAQHVQFLLLDRLPVGLGDELALGLLLNVLLVFPQHHLARRFARPKPRQVGLAPKILRHGLEGFIHLLRLDFHPHELLARGQILYRHIHKQTFPLVAKKVQRSRIVLQFPPLSEPATLGKRRPRVKPAKSPIPVELAGVS